MNDTFDDNDSNEDYSNDYGHFCIIDYDVYMNESYNNTKPKTIQPISKKMNAKMRQKLRESRKPHLDKDFENNENLCIVRWLLRLWNYITH